MSDRPLRAVKAEDLQAVNGLIHLKLHKSLSQSRSSGRIEVNEYSCAALFCAFESLRTLEAERRPVDGLCPLWQLLV